MKYQPGLLDPFISPISGKLRSDGLLPPIEEDYVWIGDANNNPFPSPVIIDVRLDIIELRTILDKLSALKFIIQEPNIILSNAQALNQLINGFLYNTDGVLSIQTPGSGNLVLPDGMVYVGNTENFAEAQQTINPDNLPPLLQNNIWIGDATNRPVANPTFDANFGLQSQYIWRGNSANLAIQVNDLTTLETTVNDNGITLSDLINTVSTISSAVDTVTNLANGTASTVSTIVGGINFLGGFVTFFALIGSVSGLTSRLNNLTLNGIADATSTSGDVNINGHKLINVSNPSNALDVVNLQTLQSYISGFPNTLAGFVVGGPAVGGVLTTSRGPDCTLDVIPAAADVSLDNFSIIDLETLSFSNWTDMENKAQNAVNFLFIWQFFGGGVR